MNRVGKPCIVHTNIITLYCMYSTVSIRTSYGQRRVRVVVWRIWRGLSVSSRG